MLEFKPWSKKVLEDSLKKYKETNMLSILDIELGGACNFKCIYCDTPKYTQVIQYSIEQIESLILSSCVDWLFICGLGEPTVSKNRDDLIRILQLCSKYSLGCAMFSNIEEFDDELFSYVKDGILFPLFKLDSFSIEKITKIYGINETLAERQIKNIEKIVDCVIVRDGMTNVCASIVPSSYNQEELESLVDWCYENSIFPLIGDLEDAGKGKRQYHSLKVSNTNLQDLRNHIRNKYDYDYEIPICPSVLFGLHIGYDGSIMVDELSGLSCHWFWLTEPKIKKLATLTSQTFSELSLIVINNRNASKQSLLKLLNKQERLIFGGCGGDIVDLLAFYLTKM